MLPEEGKREHNEDDGPGRLDELGRAGGLLGMPRTTLGREARDLIFPLVLVLVGELVVQVFGWDRFWVLASALVVGYVGRAVFRVAASRRRTTADGINPAR